MIDVLELRAAEATEHARRLGNQIRIAIDAGEDVPCELMRAFLAAEEAARELWAGVDSWNAQEWLESA